MKKINTVVWVSVYVCVCGKNSIYYLFLELLLICLEMLSTGMENPGLLSYSILLKPIISSMHFHQDWLTLYNFVGAKSWLGSRVVCHDSLAEPHDFFLQVWVPTMCLHKLSLTQQSGYHSTICSCLQGLFRK